MLGHGCLRTMLLLATVLTNLSQGVLQVSGAEATTISTHSTELSDQRERMKPPTKRHVGSIARAGGLPSAFHGKRQQTKKIEENDEKNEILKRYLGSVVRQRLLQNQKRQDEEVNEEMVDDEAMEKRHLSSALRMGDSRIVGRSFYSPSQDKRFLGSLARTGELGEGRRTSGKKRYLGSVARVNGIPFRAKRTPHDLPEGWEPNENSDESVEDYGNEEDEDQAIGWGEVEGEDDLLIPFKRNIASLARNGWLPHTRSSQRHESETYQVSDEAPKRNYYYRPDSSLSGRSRLLSWLRREEARLKDEAEARNGQGKRTIAALARNGELPVRYRFSRSADLLPSPPFMRMASYRGGGGGGTSIRAPHAFASLHDEGWNRFKRSDTDDVPCDPWDPQRCGAHKGERKAQQDSSNQDGRDMMSIDD